MKTLKELVYEEHAGEVAVFAEPGMGSFAEAYGRGVKDALRTHGSWRRVEGQLRYYHSTGQVYVITDEEQGRPYEPHDRGVLVGNARAGDRVRLLLPPEEKWTMTKVSGESFVAVVRRAERYEKALKEIADCLGESITRIAREALGDTS